MPRVHFVKKARKDNPVCKAGESYYWWKFRYGGKRYSLTPPKRSQLTQSEYYGRLYDLADSVNGRDDIEDWDDMETLIDDVRSELDELRDDQQEKLDNMPESLRYAPTGEMLQERYDACDQAVNDIECIDGFDEEEPQESDFMRECDECNGTGQLDEDDFDDEDRDSDRECPACGGACEIEDEDEFESAMESYRSDLEQAIEAARETLTEAIDNCHV